MQECNCEQDNHNKSHKIAENKHFKEEIFKRILLAEKIPEILSSSEYKY